MLIQTCQYDLDSGLLPPVSSHGQHVVEAYSNLIRSQLTGRDDYPTTVLSVVFTPRDSDEPRAKLVL